MTALDDANTRLDNLIGRTRTALEGLQGNGVPYEQAVHALVGSFIASSRHQCPADGAANAAIAMARLVSMEDTITRLDKEELQMLHALVALQDELETM